MAIPPLKIAHRIRPKSMKLRCIQEAPGRVEKLRVMLGGLIRHERIELNSHRAAETRDYAERLIQDAVLYGPHHKRSMEMASFWLKEKELVHKLFKVIAPRLENETRGFTKIWVLADPEKTSYEPGGLPGVHYKNDWVALEIKNNPLPPIRPNPTPHRSLYIPNLLLAAAAASIA
ncbi:39S ribosomal protein L17, mitochondrial [Galendromus occidentalis]|uniref:Large ribosomal subunit protein bL17m n=1 Tax=Galendromus occidentalis TaxID=34638 RepID=A0AAJ6QUU3_9ACAR|nr:39S ribosomal protein L17, mitochondrial [Galendromus occidentalis]